MPKKDLCEVCQEKIGVKRITLNNNKFIHGYNYSPVRVNKDCAAYLEERPKEISDLVMGLYETKKSLLNKNEKTFRDIGFGFPVQWEYLCRISG